MKTADSTASPTRSSPQRAVRFLLAAIGLFLVAWPLAPLIHQDQSYHGFADGRAWHGVPNAADVLSNLAFALVGIVGVAGLLSRQRMRFPATTEAGLGLIALGIIATAVGSAWYHLNPTDATLFWDRLPLTIVFAGILGTAIAQRLGPDAGRWGLTVLPLLGIASVVYWKSTGDLSLYVLLQFGGIVTLVVLLVLARDRSDPIPWMWVIVLYVAAKIAEAGDRTIWDATNGIVAGHTLKHLLAAAAVAAALSPLVRHR
jgi:uncharacterized membrane protein HdeD (DUF308 family)